MRKKIAFALLLVISLTSCRKEVTYTETPEEQKSPTIIAEIDRSKDTKVHIDGTENNPRIKWSKDDSIKVISSEGKIAVFSVDSIYQDDSSKCTFKYKCGAVIPSSEIIYAYYPASATTTLMDDKLKVSVPPVHQYVPVGKSTSYAGSFDPEAFPMIAKAAESTNSSEPIHLSFKNIFGILQLNLKPSGNFTSVNSINISCDRPVCGQAYVSIGEGDIPVCEIPDSVGLRQVTLTAASAVTLIGDGTAFYIPIPAGDTIKRIAVISNDTLFCREVSVDVSKAVVISRSRIKNLSACSLNTFAQVKYTDTLNDYPPAMVEGVVWAPVNCGYEKSTDSYKGFTYGHLYQWNRKYGQGYDSTDARFPSSEEIILGPVKLSAGNADTSRYKFYYTEEEGGNVKCWYDSTANNECWSSDYNPCPSGWRVPSITELSRLKFRVITRELTSAGGPEKDQKGWLIGVSPSQIFLPISGYRWFDGGNYDSRRGGEDKLSGFYWSRDSYDKYKAKRLSIASQGFSSQSNVYEATAYLHRTVGASIRCVWGPER